ncbi:hypothetical protein [Mycobacterium aquaticum]|uniref:Uncharacterized protein n=1 Tax=Mycobacterium aquaticum TaxID=1927124 RepID=A0A1X0A4I1_9MYCO|nr:hypothetical protein [Mycobacterium aquaticum]ORA24924.1 hypothetical protein BST13_33695 [Mycobacterium aquaticum]
MPEMPHFEPASTAVIAKADQQQAATAENVRRAVDFYREHVAEHDGDKLCAWASLGRIVLHDLKGEPVQLADLVVGCVDRIVELENERAARNA